MPADLKDPLAALHASISAIPSNSDGLEHPPLLPTPIDLGDGHILRHATKSDRYALSAFNGFVHGNETLFGLHTTAYFDMEEMDDHLKHPTVDASFFTVVIDTKRTVAEEPKEGETEADMKLRIQNGKLITTDGLLVSSMLSIPQVWVYGETDPLAREATTTTIPPKTPPANAFWDEGGMTGVVCMNDEDDPFSAAYASKKAPRIALLAVRPEAVGTHPSYRNKGFVEAQFKAHHAWIDGPRAADLCFVTGIPGFYRKFGYELAPDYLGGRGGFTATLPNLPKDEKEPYVFRRATVEDAEFLTRVDRLAGIRRKHWTCDLDEAWWRNQVGARLLDGAFNQRIVYIIEEAPIERVVRAEKAEEKVEDGSKVEGAPPKAEEKIEETGNSEVTADAAATGIERCVERLTLHERRVGFFQIQTYALSVCRYEMDPLSREHNWSTVTHSLLRFLLVHGEEQHRKKTIDDPNATALPASQSFTLQVGSNHPSFHAIKSDNILPRIIPPFRYYVRIPNLPNLINKISPVLTHRLRRSPSFHNYMGTLALLPNPNNAAGMGGTIIEIVEGEIVEVRPGQQGESIGPLAGAGANVFGTGGNPGLITMMVMGLRTASDLAREFPADLTVTGVAKNLLDVLFPSHVVSGEIQPVD
jgi:hypothetical protein